jgi:thiamine biosynthesis lipoprotein
MSVDLGSIGKGYAADQVADYLKEQGVQKAILNLGGNILIIGEKDAGTPFRVGLQNPFDSRNEYFGVVEVMDKTVVTSGIYERNFEQDGILYHHILDTETGYPVNNSVTSVSIIADSSIDADAMSTVLFVLGVEEGLELCESIANIECVYVTNDYQVYMSSGAKNAVTITNDKFKVAN